MNAARENSENVNFQNEKIKWLKNTEKKSYIKECFCGNENCKGSIIFAHSIQNNKILKKLSLNGEVVSLSNR
jgi:hypothetical protein